MKTTDFPDSSGCLSNTVISFFDNFLKEAEQEKKKDHCKDLKRRGKRERERNFNYFTLLTVAEVHLFLTLNHSVFTLLFVWIFSLSLSLFSCVCFHWVFFLSMSLVSFSLKNQVQSSISCNLPSSSSPTSTCNFVVNQFCSPSCKISSFAPFSLLCMKREKQEIKRRNKKKERMTPEETAVERKKKLPVGRLLSSFFFIAHREGPTSG